MIKRSERIEKRAQLQVFVNTGMKLEAVKKA
jgi:hypothetical protein